MLILLALLHAVLVGAFTVRILLREDLSPPARLAWFVVLNILPYLGTAIYFLFGEIDIGHRASTQRRRILDEIRARAAHVMGEPDLDRLGIDATYRPAFAYSASIHGFHPLPGNRAQLMRDSAETLDRMVRDIDGAAHHVHALFYIWLDDRTGTAIAEALMRAAARGVTCRAMADGLGSRLLIGGPLWRRMQEAGVELAVTLPLDNPLLTVLTSRIDLRNHRKITVIDGHITYCGSQNAADPEFRLKPKYAPWVDVMLRFEGPVAAQNQLLFIADWMAATGQPLAALPMPALAAGEGFPAQVMGDGPTLRRGATPQLFSTLIACARREITISTPYFVPDSTLMDTLCATAHRGVSVTLILPARNDSWIVAAASRSFYRRLLEAGCRIFEFRGGLLHAKTLTLDDQVTVVGSTNLDLRSFDLNYENNVLLHHAPTTAALRARQADYIANANPIELGHVLAWSPQRRAWQNVVATIGPIL